MYKESPWDFFVGLLRFVSVDIFVRVFCDKLLFKFLPSVLEVFTQLEIQRIAAALSMMVFLISANVYASWIWECHSNIRIKKLESPVIKIKYFAGKYPIITAMIVKALFYTACIVMFYCFVYMKKILLLGGCIL